MRLDKYRQKRNFNETPEPEGTVSNRDTRLFVVQKHAASHLHYDFRIQLDGVLKSWAVPKGPTLDPTVKRLSIHVEDHPIEYGTFEGIIPKGEYGGGTVLLWDKGVWEPLDKNPVQAYHKGHIRILLFAEKLKGRWDLIQFKSEDSPNNTWFLVKFNDVYARSLESYDVTKSSPNSVISGKSLVEIAENYNAVWTKEGLKKPIKNLKEKPKFKPHTLELSASPFPDFIKPQLATLVDKAPEGEDWAHEIKFDGYRILAFKNGKTIRLLSRNQKDWTQQFKIIADELQKIPLSQVVLDGEVVVLDKKNRPSFQLLQASVKNEKSECFIYYIFDILYYHKWDVRELSFIDRKNLLQPVLQHISSQIRYSDYVIGQSKEFYERSCEFALEGIISKKLDSSYQSKRSKSWLKVKCSKRQEFVIAGFSSPNGSRPYFGSLFLGAYDAHGKFIFCGKVGTGFTNKALKIIYTKLKTLITDKNPFEMNPPGAKSPHWVQPKLVAEIEFIEWTDKGRLRHPSFKGLREDKNAEEVYKELEEPIEKVTMPKKNTNIQTVKLTSLKKILYPEEKISKGDIYNYYSSVASFILPFIQNRLLTLVRCPDNYQDCFYQKHRNKSTAKTLLSLPIENKKRKKENYIYLSDENGLFGLVQMGVLEIHPWGSTINHIELPDMITFDLDPSPELLWEKTVQAAFEIKKFLEALSLRSFIKNTGGKGLHVVVPIQPKYDWEIIKKFAEMFVKFVERQNPDNYVTTMSKSKRKGKIYLDYLRNQRNATAIAAYSTRARAGAPVATSLHWDELTNNIKDTFYTIHTLPDRLSNLKKDPWEDFWDIKQELKL